MIERVLIATDGSEHADPAVEYGLELAQLAGAEVHALYVAETHASYILTVELDDASREELEEFGEKTVADVVAQASDRGLSGKGAVRVGKIAPEIIEYAEEQGIDHIVVGRQGRGAVEQYLGSTAEKVVRMSDQPVTVVRSE